MTQRRNESRRVLIACLAGTVLACRASIAEPTTGRLSQAATTVVDPGVRAGAPSGGGPLPGLGADEAAFFADGLARFQQLECVTGCDHFGLGPRFNSTQCSSCHSQPSVGGTAPSANPLVAVATAGGAANTLPWFISADGPIRVARLKLDQDGTPNGGVFALFVVTGRTDASGCNIAQYDFSPAGEPLSGQGGNPNVSFRIPTPLFGSGLIEAIPDSAILGNMEATAAQASLLGICGHPNTVSGAPNRSGNDGTISRFGWKAQNKSLLLFAGEAYNVEIGVTNQLFPQERDETPGCVFNPTPEDTLNMSASTNEGVLSDIEAFANFMRLLAPCEPAPDTASTASGRYAFQTIGCALCHTPSLPTGASIASGSATSFSAALSGQTVNLYSDLLVHHMGEGLEDGITQGEAGPDEFRTAPLWGLGQRAYFLHDGRTASVLEAVEAHRSTGSEANQVVENFNQLSPGEQQDLVDFLRSL